MRRRDAFLLGAVQGLTEFLPVSSSAHLMLLRRLTGQDDIHRAFDVALHLGTAAALLVSTRQDWSTALCGLRGGGRSGPIPWSRGGSGPRLAGVLGLSMLPAVAAGALYHDGFEQWGRQRNRLAAGLLLGALPMTLAELLPHRRRTSVPADVPFSTVLLMGVAQAAALAPGISRSGATIAAGMIAGLGRSSAARLSFLLAVPVSVAALVRSLPALRRLLRRTGAAPLVTGITASFLTGLVGIQLMRRLLGTGGLWPFVLYRCALAAALWLSDRDASDKSETQRLTPSPRD